VIHTNKILITKYLKMTSSKLKNYPSIAQSFGITGIASLAILSVGVAAPILMNLAGVEAGQLLFEILAMGIPLLIIFRIRNKKIGYLPINLSLKNKRILPYLVIASIALLIGIINPLSSLIPNARVFETRISYAC
jgi:hypothetical protein